MCLLLLGASRVTFAQTIDNPLSATGPGWYQPYGWTSPSGTGLTTMTNAYPGFYTPTHPASAARIEYTQFQMQYSMRADVWMRDSLLWGINGRPAIFSLAIPLLKKGGLGVFGQLMPLAKAGHRWTVRDIDTALPVHITRIHKGALQSLHFGMAWRPLSGVAISAGPVYAWGLYQSQDEFVYPDTLAGYWDAIAIEYLRVARWGWMVAADARFETGTWTHQVALSYAPAMRLSGTRTIDEGLILTPGENPTRIRTDTLSVQFTFPSIRRVGYALSTDRRRLFLEYEQSTDPGAATAFRFGSWTQPFRKISAGYEWKPDRSPAAFLYGFRYGVGAYHTRQPFTYAQEPVREQGISFGASFQAGNSPSRINIGMQLGRILPTDTRTHWVAHFHLGINIAEKWFRRPYWE